MKRRSEQVADEWLVLRSQEGSRAALNLLLKRWRPRLGVRALRLTNDADAVDDILQETLIAITRGIARLRDPAGFSAWAFRIVSNKSQDWIRRQIRDRNVPVEESGEQMVTVSEGPSETVRECLSGLPAEDREILRLHYYEGLSIREIAEIEQVPGGSIKSRLFYARQRLRKQVEEELNLKKENP